MLNYYGINVMANFNELLNKANKLHKVENAEADTIDFADRALLDVGANFFEVLFSHLLSFQWLSYFLRK
jgi:hypothetical protein